MKALTTICAAALLLCGSLLAQNVVDQLNVRLTTPVLAGETTLPAGDVNIQVMRGNSDNVTLIFRTESGVTATAIVNRVVEAEGSAAGARLVLKNVNGTVRLDRVMMGDRTGFQLLPQD